jgi:hypothetical protein
MDGFPLDRTEDYLGRGVADAILGVMMDFGYRVYQRNCGGRKEICMTRDHPLHAVETTVVICPDTDPKKRKCTLSVGCGDDKYIEGSGLKHLKDALEGAGYAVKLDRTVRRNL